MVVTDPKGELFQETAEYIANHGYEVFRFNSQDSSQSHS
jgi:type IV secretory pathway TraG/TraD family ATPase VirD4